VPRVYLLLHNNGDLLNSTVADRLSMLPTRRRFPWKAPTKQTHMCICRDRAASNATHACLDLKLEKLQLLIYTMPASVIAQGHI
jgi:hypothetical protein